MKRSRFDNYNGFGMSTGRTHGTVSCYHWELANKIPPCDDCKAAGSRSRARARAARRARGGRVS